MLAYRSGRLLHGILLLWTQWTVVSQPPPLAPLTMGSVGLDPTQAPFYQTKEQRLNLTIPLAVYILEGDDRDLSSDRTAEEVAQIFGRVNEIWSQANIELKLVRLQRVAIPNDILWRLTRSQWNFLWTAINTGRVDIDRRVTPIWGFFVRSLGRNMNGVHPLNRHYPIFLCRRHHQCVRLPNDGT